MNWTPKLVDELKSLWKQGLTTVEIGNKLGLSKNSIVGKAHRLGLESRPSPIKRDDIKKALPSYDVTEEKAEDFDFDEKDSLIAEEPAFKEEPLPPEVNVHKSKKHKGVPLVDLKPNSCRWPEGDPKDPNFHFCGEPVVAGKIYCPEHCAVAYSGVFRAK